MDGSVYDGNWEFDEKSGKGEIYYIDGSKF